MPVMRDFAPVVVGLLMLLCAVGCAGKQPADGAGRATDPPPAGSLDHAIRETMTEARQAVDELGITEPAMKRIQSALGRLAGTPGIKEGAVLREIHGGGVASAVLRSEGPEGLTLILARFQPGVTTPIHDHGTWAVAYVVEGREHYTEWERSDDGSDPHRAEIRVKHERILSPGDSVYWLDPPHDIHSQKTLEGVTWELILFGRNPLHGTLHYFDASTGRVTSKAPVAPAGRDEGER